MDLKTQQRLAKLQDQGYKIFWTGSPYVSSIAHAYIHQVSQAYIDQEQLKCKSGEYVYNDNVNCDVELNSINLSSIQIWKRHSTSTLVSLEEYDDLPF